MGFSHENGFNVGLQQLNSQGIYRMFSIFNHVCVISNDVYMSGLLSSMKSKKRI